MPDTIFSLENEMLKSIEAYIRPETTHILMEKIHQQENILLGITNKESKIQEKINAEPTPIIDDNYFDKKPLNINNI